MVALAPTPCSAAMAMTGTVDNAADTVFENVFDTQTHRMFFTSGIDTVFAPVNFTLGS